MNKVCHLEGANRGRVDIPLFDPVVARHFAEPNSNTGTLMDEVFLKEIYAPLFKGRSDLTFLDIGANIGLVSLYAYDACQRIVAVEPAPATFEVLKAMTVKLPNIEPVCAALAPVDGPCEMFINDVNTTASSTVNTYGTLTEVPGLTLASLLSIYQLEHIDVVKCDAEGSEWESLSYEQLEKAAGVIDVWWLELHNLPRVSWELSLATKCDVLMQLGYRNQEINGMRILARK